MSQLDTAAITVEQPAVSAKPKRQRSLTAYQRRWGMLMGGPAFFLLGFFVILPFIMAIVLTFTNQRLLSPNPTEYVGMRNYERLLSVTMLTQEAVRDEQGQIVLDRKGETKYPRLRTITRKDPAYKGYRELASFSFSEGKRYVILAKDPVFIKSLWNTLRFALMVVPLQCGAALGLAMLINLGLRGTNFFRTVYFAPVVTSMVVVSIVWSFLYNKDIGVINEYLKILSFGALGPIDWLGDTFWSMPAVVIMSAWQGAGVQMLIFLAGLQGISQDLYEAASIDGANGWQKFLHITLPGLRNTIMFIIISTTIAAFGLFTQIDVMTNGGPADSTTTVMYHAVKKSMREQDIAYGATITVIYFVIILLIALLQKRFFDKQEG